MRLIRRSGGCEFVRVVRCAVRGGDGVDRVNSGACLGYVAWWGGGLGVDFLGEALGWVSFRGGGGGGWELGTLEVGNGWGKRGAAGNGRWEKRPMINAYLDL